MKKNLAGACISCLLVAISATAQHNAIMDSTLQFFNLAPKPIPAKFECLPAGAVKPAGWIREQMLQDITTGFVGKMDTLVPAIMQDDIYGTAQRKSTTDIPHAGTQVLTGADWEISMQWWNSESQGNWWDGFIRNAYMVGDKASMAKADKFISHVLACQDNDGYIGIYGKAMRYQHQGDNGELWSQATLFRTMLGYYELTGRTAVLQAVIKAMDLTMSHYNENAANPFNVKNDFGGVSHGLMITDVCETLYNITHKEKYAQFILFLYKGFSQYPLNRYFNDVRYASLMAADSLFISHAAHTYEHLRSLLAAYRLSNYPQLAAAYSNALSKLDKCMLPGGAGFGDEFLVGKKADPYTSSAEYCAMLELRNFFTSALQKTGDAAYADKAEKLTFNSMQGARFANGKGITYCKPDNCFVLDEKSPLSNFTQTDVRYKYSPTHQDAAVCCNPNYGRNLPYYVNNMWMQAGDGFAKVLYGPSSLQTKFNGTDITIAEATSYPFSDKVELIITPGKEMALTLYFRKPEWSKSVQVTCDGATITDDGAWIKVYRKWKKGDHLALTFQNEINITKLDNGDALLQRGALVYALAIPWREDDIKAYAVDGFKDFRVFATDSSFKNMSLSDQTGNGSAGFVYKDDNSDDPWYNGHTALNGKLFNTATKTYQPVNLVPMGSTVLRRVTFPLK